MTTFADVCTHEALFSATDDTVDGAEWATPQRFFDELNEEFHFTLDACASDENFKVANYYTKEQNSLSLPWTGVVWCNPPYGKDIKLWLQKGSNP